MLAGGQVGEEGRVKALEPKFRVSAVETTLELHELRCRDVICSGEGKGSRTTVGDQGRLLGDDGIGRLCVSSENVNSRCWIDVAGAVDGTHLKSIEAKFSFQQWNLPGA